jgi:hypothetical protein
MFEITGHIAGPLNLLYVVQAAAAKFGVRVGDMELGTE